MYTVFHKPEQTWVGRLVNYQKSWHVKHRLLFWAMLFIYLDKHFLFHWKKCWKGYSEYIFMRLDGVFQWLRWPALHTEQLYVIFVALTAKHWLPFYSDLLVHIVSMASHMKFKIYLLSVLLICSFLELHHVFEQHSILISWITVSLPYCWNKHLCCVPSTHSSEWFQSSSSYAFFLLRECPSWGAQQSHNPVHL